MKLDEIWWNTVVECWEAKCTIIQELRSQSPYNTVIIIYGHIIIYFFYHETSAMEIEIAQNKILSILQKSKKKISKASTGTLIGTQSKSPRFLFKKISSTNQHSYGYSKLHLGSPSLNNHKISWPLCAMHHLYPLKMLGCLGIPTTIPSSPKDLSLRRVSENVFENSSKVQA